MYICKNNVLLEEAKIKISYDFEHEFLGRQVNDEFESNRNKLESGYFRNNEYIMKGIYFSCDIETDENNCFSCISFGKYRDKYAGHGRPISDEFSLNVKDKKAIRECLNNSLVESQEDDYKALVESIKNKSKLKKFNVIDVSAKGVILSTNKEIFIPKKEIIKILNLSHTYIDILYDKNIYKNNDEIVAKELIEPLLAIFSCYDYSKYPNIEKLRLEAETRKICFKSEKGYKSLIKALKNKDQNNIRKYIEYSIIVTQSSKDIEKPLILALNNCKECVGEMLKAGSYANPSYWYKDERGVSKVETAIGVAYKNKDYKSLKLIVRCYDSSKMEHKPFEFNDYSSYDSAMRMYNASVKYCIEESFNKKALEILIPHMDFKGGLELPKSYDLKYDQIEFLAEFEGLKIKWEVKEFELAHSICAETCKKMIKQGCSVSAINTFIDLDEFELFKYCAENYTNGQSYYFKKESFIKLFSKPSKWYEIARELEKHNFNFTDEYLDELKSKDFKKFEATIKKYGI